MHSGREIWPSSNARISFNPRALVCRWTNILQRSHFFFDSRTEHRVHSFINSLVEIVAVAQKKHAAARSPVPTTARGQRPRPRIFALRDGGTGRRDLNRADYAPPISSNRCAQPFPDSIPSSCPANSPIGKAVQFRRVASDPAVELHRIHG